MWNVLYRLADLARRRWRRALSPEQSAGLLGEDLAHRHLRRHGYTIVARNYRPRSGGGEIDLVAWDRGTLVFVEVKTRTSDDFGEPERAVDAQKQLFLTRAARAYARHANIAHDSVRFDVVSILLTRPPNIRLIKDAFRLSQRI